MFSKKIIISLLTAIIMLFAGCKSSTPASDSATTRVSLNPITPLLNTSTASTISITNTTLKDKELNSNKTAFSQTAAPVNGDTIAIIKTDLGTIKFKLFTEQVPEMTKNFEQLTKAGKFNGVPFHRVVNNFMIQTGDFTNKNGTGGYSYLGPGTKLNDEIVSDLKHLYGTVSMANAGPNTNGSQFFIVTNKKGTSFLDGNYTVFGQVFAGQEIADKIAALEISGTEKPAREVKMLSVKIESYTR